MRPRNTAILEALVNRIIPPDDYPSGWEAGLGDYLAQQFQRDLKNLLPIYQLGLEALDAEALAVYGAAFDTLPAPSQDELLTRVERGTVTTLWMVDAAAFFRMVVEHTAEGYYSDPGNGGNKDAASWQMIGFQVRP